MTYSEQTRSLDHLAASINEKYEKLASLAWVHLIFWVFASAWLYWISFNPDRLSVPCFIISLSLVLFSTVHWFLSEFLWPRGLAVVAGVMGAWLLNALARPDIYNISAFRRKINLAVEKAIGSTGTDPCTVFCHNLVELVWIFKAIGSSEKRIMVEMLFADAVEGSPCFVEETGARFWTQKPGSALLEQRARAGRTGSSRCTNVK